MSYIDVKKIKSPWDIILTVQGVNINFFSVILRECEVDNWILDWCKEHLSSNPHLSGHTIYISYARSNFSASAEKTKQTLQIK